MPVPVALTLGSNVEPRRHLLAAVAELRQVFVVRAVSPVYESEPVESTGAPRFFNAAAVIETAIEPLALKYDHLRRIEARLGRVRGPNRNAPRTIDIDIALVEGRVIEERSGRLRVPDPDLHRFAHLAHPLADVAPDMVHPLIGQTLAQIASRLDRGALTRVEDLDLAAGE